MSEVQPDTSEYGHRPVMPSEVQEVLAPQAGEVCLDLTLGAGGHADFLLSGTGVGKYVGLDRDGEALARTAERLAAKYSDRFVAQRAPFSDVVFALRRAGFSAVDLVLADLGVSSMQLDEAERGFSFRSPEAPLDLRMDQATGQTAADKIKDSTEEELSRLLREYGEIRSARRLSSLMKASPPETTGDLVALSQKIYSGHKQHKFLAKVFQALRVWVNDEMGQLKSLLSAIPTIVRRGARVAILSYHSLEDRMVKQIFREWEGGCVCPPDLPVCQCDAVSLGRRINRKAMRASAAEVGENPRARSALLRGFRFEVAQNG